MTAGLDYATAYYFRGYLQADHGPIQQPYLNLFVPCTCGEGLVVSPYVALFNSTHFAENNRMAEMSDAMLGTITRWHGMVLDTRYAYYDTAPQMRSAVHELGLRASADVLSPWGKSAPKTPFSLRSYAGLYGELSDQESTEDVYLETGLEPSWRFEAAGRKIGIGLPLLLGWSVDDYYFDDLGNNAALGYFSAAVTASVCLPVPQQCGAWFLNVSCQYLHLFADNLEAINDGRRDVFIGKVGIGLAF